MIKQKLLNIGRVMVRLLDNCLETAIIAVVLIFLAKIILHGQVEIWNLFFWQRVIN